MRRTTLQCSHRFLTELWTFMPRACGFCTSSVTFLGATASGRATGRNAADERLRISVVLGAAVAGVAASDSVRIDVDRRDKAAAPDRAIDGVHIVAGGGAFGNEVVAEEQDRVGGRRVCC